LAVSGDFYLAVDTGLCPGAVEVGDEGVAEVDDPGGEGAPLTSPTEGQTGMKGRPEAPGSPLPDSYQRPGGTD
jgi:hypothetical protein